MEILSPSSKKKSAPRKIPYISGNGNPKRIPYISGNETF